MSATKLDQFVVNRMQRALAGDDEALNGMVLELRPLALELIPRPAVQGVPVHVVTASTNEAVIALHEALILWLPDREAFVVCLERRVVQRIRALFQRLQDLSDQVTGRSLFPSPEALCD